jgi:putative ABC transport system permease protein
MDDAIFQMYQAEDRFLRVFTAFSGIAILIACLGIFGLATFMAVQRTKEIGIRKVLGASVSSIVKLLSSDFTRLVLVAFIIAVPIASFIMHKWLQAFAYRIEIGVDVFVVAGITALVIAWITVSYQSFKAAMSNPVESLRNE